MLKDKGLKSINIKRGLAPINRNEKLSNYFFSYSAFSYCLAALASSARKKIKALERQKAPSGSFPIFRPHDVGHAELPQTWLLSRPSYNGSFLI